jgi:Zn-finger nucleic acid-binding protein
MRCPKCDSEFETFTEQSISIRRCTGCRGIWLDALEPLDRTKINASVGIDSGNRKTGRRYNETHNIDCPRCAVKMLTVTDSIQTHIEFESCPACAGCFFDAGELKDLTELTLVERLKAMLDRLLPIR